MDDQNSQDNQNNQNLQNLDENNNNNNINNNDNNSNSQSSESIDVEKVSDNVQDNELEVSQESQKSPASTDQEINEEVVDQEVVDQDRVVEETQNTQSGEVSNTALNTNTTQQHPQDSTKQSDAVIQEPESELSKQISETDVPFNWKKPLGLMLIVALVAVVFALILKFMA